MCLLLGLNMYFSYSFRYILINHVTCWNIKIWIVLIILLLIRYCICFCCKISLCIFFHDINYTYINITCTKFLLFYLSHPSDIGINNLTVSVLTMIFSVIWNWVRWSAQFIYWDINCWNVTLYNRLYKFCVTNKTTNTISTYDFIRQRLSQFIVRPHSCRYTSFTLFIALTFFFAFVCRRHYRIIYHWLIDIKMIRLRK